MRRRISLLVAATTSAVVLAFVLPLCLLVRSVAADRAVAQADQEARGVAVLVSSLHGRAALADAVAAAGTRGTAATTLVLQDGTRIGSVAGAGGLTAGELARARRGEAFTVHDATGTRILVPVVTAEGVDVVSTWVTLAQMRRGVVRAWTLLALLGIVLTGIALAVADQLGRRISTPVSHVAAVADRLREGDLGARAVVEGAPETQALATSLNRLGARVEELLLSERAAVADLSHRLRTPVTALRIDVEEIADPALAERLQGHVGHLQRTVDAIVKDARRPVRREMDQGCDAVHVVRTAVEFWAPLAEDEGRALEVHLDRGPLWVDVDEVDLRDLVDILIDNVFAHTRDGTPFAVSLVAAGPAGGAVLEVADRGAPDPAADTRDTEGRGPGTGLGLSIVRRTLAARGGELHQESGESGTTAVVRLPGAAAR